MVKGRPVDGRALEEIVRKVHLSLEYGSKQQVMRLTFNRPMSGLIASTLGHGWREVGER